MGLEKMKWARRIRHGGKNEFFREDHDGEDGMEEFGAPEPEV